MVLVTSHNTLQAKPKCSLNSSIPKHILKDHKVFPILIIVNIIGEGNENKLIIVAKGKIGVYTKDGKLIDQLNAGKMYNDALLLNLEPVSFVALKETYVLLLSRYEFLKYLDVSVKSMNRNWRMRMVRRS